jgi:hypothetical protein
MHNMKYRVLVKQLTKIRELTPKTDGHQNYYLLTAQWLKVDVKTLWHNFGSQFSKNQLNKKVDVILEIIKMKKKRIKK